jgi:chemotaxis methyl-accepting protein methylase
LKSLNPSKGNAAAKMDIILMRNALMYFNAETKKAIFAKVKRVLKRDG